MGNALNFRFSKPHYRFVGERLGRSLFSTRAANKNLASFIVSRGRCKVGDVLLLLFPSLTSAMAAGERHRRERKDDITEEIQIPSNTGWAGRFRPTFD